MHGQRTVGSVLIVVLLAAAISALAVAAPAVRIHLDSASAGTIVVTVRGVAELFAAFLAGHRFARTASRVDFAVAVGLGVMAVADIVFALGRATIVPDAASAATVLPYQVAGAGLLAVAAFSLDRPLVRRPRGRIVAVFVAEVALGLLLLQQTGLIPSGAGGGEPLGIVLLRIATCALLAAAAAGFALGSPRRADPLLRWLTAAVALAALAQFQRVAVPVPATAVFTWVHVLVLGSAAALLVGCAEEIRRLQRRSTEVAVAEERRRMARDLHDGLAQDVAFIASQSQWLAEQSRDDGLELIAAAAQRALDDSRFVIGALTRASSQPLSASIALQAQEFARRWGLRVQLALQDDVDVAPEKEQAILRIVGEALSNAARHAGASTVNIDLGNRDGRLHVAVCDDGRGFDAEAERVAERGFGLRSMHERALLVGGDLRLESVPGGGTRVEIAIT
jgi:signal transduction histidine kinase